LLEEDVEEGPYCPNCGAIDRARLPIPAADREQSGAELSTTSDAPGDFAHRWGRRALLDSSIVMVLAAGVMITLAFSGAVEPHWGLAVVLLGIAGALAVALYVLAVLPRLIGARVARMIRKRRRRSNALTRREDERRRKKLFEIGFLIACSLAVLTVLWEFLTAPGPLRDGGMGLILFAAFGGVLGGAALGGALAALPALWTYVLELTVWLLGIPLAVEDLDDEIDLSPTARRVTAPSPSDRTDVTDSPGPLTSTGTHKGGADR
jgi:hypothetical protein